MFLPKLFFCRADKSAPPEKGDPVQPEMAKASSCKKKPRLTVKDLIRNFAPVALYVFPMR